MENLEAIDQNGGQETVLIALKFIGSMLIKLCKLTLPDKYLNRDMKLNAMAGH